jgi:hypothetical protein
MLRGTTLAHGSGSVCNDIVKEGPQMNSLPRRIAARALSLTCMSVTVPARDDST